MLLLPYKYCVNSKSIFLLYATWFICLICVSRLDSPGLELLEKLLEVCVDAEGTAVDLSHRHQTCLQHYLL